MTRCYLLFLPLVGIPFIAGCVLPLPFGYGCGLLLPAIQKTSDAIEGSVVDGRTGLPVRGATVWVQNQTCGLASKTQTDFEGHYRLDAQCCFLLVFFTLNVQETPAEVDIWIDAPGYQPTTYRGAVLTGTEARSHRDAESSSTEPLIGTFSWGTWHFTPIRLVAQEPPPPSAGALPP